MMIERLAGRLLKTLPTGIILDVGGVGYGVEMPLSALCEVGPTGSDVIVWTYTHVREDTIKLFGFLTYEDRQIFEILLSISQVGPKVALAILSTLSLAALRRAVQNEQPAILEAVPGIGKLKAEKLLVELKPKLKRLQVATGGLLERQSGRLDAEDVKGLGLDEEILDEQGALFEDLRSALENLGFREKEIAPLLEHLQATSPQATFQELMRQALLELSGQGAGKRSPASQRSSARGKEASF